MAEHPESVNAAAQQSAHSGFGMDANALKVRTCALCIFHRAGSWFIFHDVGIALSPRYELLGIFTFAALLVA
jgi:hypothetical protein